MNCRHLKHNLEAYVRHEMDEDSEKQVAAHLKICANCRSLHDAVFVIHVALKDVPRHAARSDFNARALEKLEKLQDAKTTVQRVDEIAHARLSPWRRLVLWLDSLVPRGLLRYSSPAMAGITLGLILAIALILSPGGRETIQVMRQAGEVTWWKQWADNNWMPVTPNATPFATSAKPDATPVKTQRSEDE